MTREHDTKGGGKAVERSGDKPGEGFAGRWSRMKRDATAPVAQAKAAEPSPPAKARSDEEILRDLGLPDPDTLKPGDDITGFMAGAVPARIRNRVLRRLWSSNPVLANLDGLVDYGEDFTDAAMVPAVLQSAYKVGRGWARDASKAEPEDMPVAPGANPDVEGDVEDHGSGVPGADEQGQEGASQGEEDRSRRESAARFEPRSDAITAAGESNEPLAQPAAPSAPEPQPPARLRRMQFRFRDD